MSKEIKTTGGGRIALYIITSVIGFFLMLILIPVITVQIKQQFATRVDYWETVYDNYDYDNDYDECVVEEVVAVEEADTAVAAENGSATCTFNRVERNSTYNGTRGVKIFVDINIQDRAYDCTDLVCSLCDSTNLQHITYNGQEVVARFNHTPTSDNYNMNAWFFIPAEWLPTGETYTFDIQLFDTNSNNSIVRCNNVGSFYL